MNKGISRRYFLEGGTALALGIPLGYGIKTTSAQQTDWRTMERQPYLEKEVLGISPDYDLQARRGHTWTEFRDKEGKGRGFRKVQWNNRQGDLLELIDLENDGWLTPRKASGDNSGNEDKDATLDVVLRTTADLNEIKRPVSRDGPEGNDFYQQATQLYREKVRPFIREVAPKLDLLK